MHGTKQGYARARGGRAAAGAALATAVTVAFALQGAATTTQGVTRQSGIQLTPDSHRYLISKDVPEGSPTERWAISYNLDDQTVTGNVFPLDGGPPQFVACQITSRDPAPNPADVMYHLTCQFAQSCASAPCVDQWSAPIEVPPLPGSFLLPTNTLSTLEGNVQPILTEDCASSPSCHAGARSPDLEAGETYGETVGIAAGEDPSKSYVAPFNGAGSYLLDKVLGIASSGGRMPPTGPLSDDEIDAIRNWILEGAANN